MELFIIYFAIMSGVVGYGIGQEQKTCPKTVIVKHTQPKKPIKRMGPPAPKCK